MLLNVIVDPEFKPVSSIIALSCNNGKSAAVGLPPLLDAHAVLFQLPPAGKFQYLLAPALKVISVLPPPSPKSVPDQGIAAPFASTRIKSIFCKPDIEPAEIVIPPFPTTAGVTTTLLVLVADLK